MKFIETPIFTEEIQRVITDEDYRALQLALLFRPEQGALIPGSGGLRKIRWKTRTSGKRGGLRIIYYWLKPDNTIFMLLVYKKSESEDLTKKQLKILSRIIEEELK